MQSFAVQNELPPGWNATHVSHKGKFDPVNRQVKWGPFFDNQPRELTYQTTSSRDTANEALFAGPASFDGNRVVIAGSRHVRATVRLASWKRSANGDLTLTLHGRPGAELTIEVSNDLQTWTAVGTAMNPDGEAIFQVPASRASASRFFRAVAGTDSTPSHFRP